MQYPDLLAPAAPARTEWQTESWRLLRDEWAADGDAETECRERCARRALVRPELVALLGRFAGGVIGLEELRATLDRRTRTDWDAFGLRGASGAMFLNALAKQSGDPVALTEALRAVVRAPLDVSAAARQLHAFLEFLLRAAPPLARRGAAGQATRAVFFAGMCWHAQEPDRWPGFHFSARRVLHAEDELFVPSGDPVRDFLAFRDAFLSLAAALRLTTWELEHLCWWQARPRAEESDDDPLAEPSATERRFRRAAIARKAAAALSRSVECTVERVVPPRVVRERGPGYAPRPADRADEASESSPDHTRVQWLLATLGRKLGCRVWIAPNDWRRRCEGEALGALSIPELPTLGVDAASQRVVAAIDVVWLRGAREVVAAFEVEHTTAVYSGLLRLADLVTLSPNLSFPLYVVAPASRLAKVRREIARPAFRQLGLPARCGFFSSESLAESAPSLARWGSDPATIDRLAERVADDAR